LFPAKREEPSLGELLPLRPKEKKGFNHGEEELPFFGKKKEFS